MEAVNHVASVDEAFDIDMLLSGEGFYTTQSSNKLFFGSVHNSVSFL